MTSKKIAVGSKNPVKINSAKIGFELVWPKINFEVIGAEVESKVSDQPMTDKECIIGAKNRAKAALKASSADYGIGIEGGLQKIGTHWFTSGWVVVVDKDGNEGIGSSIGMELPEKIMKLIKGGMELGHACDQVFNQTNSKHNQGYFGLMTNGLITRTHGYQDAVVTALGRFIQSELFEN